MLFQKYISIVTKYTESASQGNKCQQYIKVFTITKAALSAHVYINLKKKQMHAEPACVGRCNLRNRMMELTSNGIYSCLFISLLQLGPVRHSFIITAYCYVCKVNIELQD